MSAVREDFASALLPREVIQALDAAVERLGRDQLVWSSGYLAGLAAARRSSAAEALPQEQALAASPERAQSAAGAEPSEPWLVMYATETGNSRRIAETLGAQLRDEGFESELIDLRDYDPKALKRCSRATFVLATHGLGDPAEGTERFFSFWMGKRAPRLEQLRYSVLALGDSSYEEFCGIGREFDARLEALGAQRLYERVDCDVDFDDPARQWRDGVLARIKETDQAQDETKARSARSAAAFQPRIALVTPRAAAARPQSPAVTRDRPFAAEVLVNQKITGRDSTKDVRHIELSLEGSELSYLPGDSIGVWHENPPALVGALLDLLELDGESRVELGGDSLSLRDALTRRLEVTKLSRGFVQAYAELTGNAELCALLSSNDALVRYMASRQIIDLIAEHPGRAGAQEFVQALRKLTPRLYSAASSLDANPGEVHLTVGVVSYRKFRRLHWGAASGFLAEAAQKASIYAEPNDHFRLPADPAAPVIMIGAGTGVAPYRAFMQHRREHGARGDNWLIYGDRNMRSDFLYQLEWLRQIKDGTLNRLSAAFSRDQERKIYVQHRIAEEAREVYSWLESGAHVYVCGEAENMAPAVHAALIGVIQSAGGRKREAAEDYLQELKIANRYQRDVY